MDTMKPIFTHIVAQKMHDHRASNASRTLPWWIVALLMVLITGRSAAVQVQDIARLRGAEGLPLVGIGLVVGLNGTGDKDVGPSHRMAREIIMRLADDTTTLADLSKVKSIALVMVHARIPETGVVAGDRIDCFVSTMHGAKSLVGGTLALTVLHDPLPQSNTAPGQPLPSGAGIYGLASGPLLLEDPENVTNARVRLGLHTTRDVTPNVINAAGQIELVLDEPNAAWPVAKNIAALVNGLGALGQDVDIARAVSPKSVLVQLPPAERRQPAAFISRILESYIDASQVTSGARVLINEKAQVIVIDADVEFTPTVMTVRGLTITGLRPAPDPADLPPTPVTDRFIGIDPQHRQRGKSSLQDLVDAFNLFDVPFEDQANAIRTLHESGNLHAKLEEL